MDNSDDEKWEDFFGELKGDIFLNNFSLMFMVKTINQVEAFLMKCYVINKKPKGLRNLIKMFT